MGMFLKNRDRFFTFLEELGLRYSGQGLRLGRTSLIVRQDRAPSHTAGCFWEEVPLFRIMPIAYPLFSLDLNPIKSVWDQMKTHIDGHHPEDYVDGQRYPNRVSETITEA